jgi:hypothetical protein
VNDALAATLQRALGDGYRVDRELGGGGMSRVVLAHDLSLDRDVVVIELSDEATVGVSAERFRREIQLIARLPNVDAGVDTRRAVSDEGMREGGFLMAAEMIDRMIVARALRRRGAPADVERYLM